MTESELAGRLHRDLGALALDVEWSTVVTDEQPQGSYTDPIADAKEEAEIEDLEDATAAQLKSIKRTALNLCFDRLLIHYAATVDVSGDGKSESFSQISIQIERARTAVLGRAAKGAKLRGYPRPDYTLGEGNA